MSRVYGNVDESTLHLIDDLAGKAGLNRSEWISKAIESYLHLGDAESRTQEIQQQSSQQVQEIAHLRELLQVRESEIQHLRNMTNDLRALADNMASKIPALPPGQEEAKAKSWWQFWR
jgi:Ribbon-helix-helix protein, copG family.